MSRRRSPKKRTRKKRIKRPQQPAVVAPLAKKEGAASKKLAWIALGACLLLVTAFALWRLNIIGGIRAPVRAGKGVSDQRPTERQQPGVSSTSSSKPSAPPPVAPDIPGQFFTDVAKQSGITFVHRTCETGRMLYPEIMGAGVILFDYDNDGDLDIYFLNGNYIRGKPPDPKLTNVLYRNDGNWHFTDVTYEAGVADTAYGQGGEAADFDNDGDQDLYITNLGANVYFRNEGNGKFTRTSLLAHPAWGQCCSAVDYDNDGDLDIYLVNYLDYDAENQPIGTETVAGKIIHEYRGPMVYQGSPDVLYRNNGDGSFTDVTKQVGLYAPGGKGMGLGIADYDNDGDPDVFVANDFMINYLFVNERGRFAERGMELGVAVSGDGNLESSMGVDVADIDNDGLFDLIVPCRHRETHTLYRNGGRMFYDASPERGLDEATLGYTGFSPSFLDYDNDGDMDLVISTGRVVTLEDAARKGLESFHERYAQVDLLLENDGKGYFRTVPPKQAGAHFRTPTVSRGTAVGDLDNDGDIDVVINVSNARPAILRNDTKSGHWLTLQLVGTKSNRDAIGARVVARVGDRVQHHYLRGGGSYLSVSDRRVHLGLGSATAADSVEITWPSGTRQRLQNVTADQFLTVREGEDTGE